MLGLAVGLEGPASGPRVVLGLTAVLDNPALGVGEPGRLSAGRLDLRSGGAIGIAVDPGAGVEAGADAGASVGIAVPAGVEVSLDLEHG